MLLGILFAIYGYLVVVALTNVLLMRRPRLSGDPSRVAFAIPARNEAENLARLVPTLRDQGARVYVFDDESDDDTATIAAKAGATVIRAREPLPQGWTGKNRGCHELAKVVAEDFSGEWLTFLDADMHPGPNFVAEWAGLLERSRAPVVTGFPRVIPGVGLEPLYLGWVAWSLGATNPFGLVARSRMGHNMFTNGQICAWRTGTYFEVKPNETVRDQLLEDVMIGRLLAKQKVRVEVTNLSGTIAVAMYRTFREALDGMSKNSCFIWPGTTGTLLFAAWLLFMGWGWTLPFFSGNSLAAWSLYGLLTLSKFLVDRLGRQPIWTLPFMPITLSLAAFTCLRSLWWKKTGRLQWKGRLYPGH